MLPLCDEFCAGPPAAPKRRGTSPTAPRARRRICLFPFNRARPSVVSVSTACTHMAGGYNREGTPQVDPEGQHDVRIQIEAGRSRRG